eukprot:scaffold10435_cov134-Skeletonema_marinoi.AAC.2
MEMKEDSAAADREDRDQAMPSEWAFIRSKLDDRNYLLVMVMAMVLCLVPRTSRHTGVRAMRSARGEKKHNSAFHQTSDIQIFLQSAGAGVGVITQKLLAVTPAVKVNRKHVSDLLESLELEGLGLGLSGINFGDDGTTVALVDGLKRNQTKTSFV